MLTYLRVKGFKNLLDVAVRFGPFTCIAGANGVGKSNLFDAIHFLSLLADSKLIDAAKSIRDDQGRSTDVRSLFLRAGDRYVTPEMSFEVEMVVPKEDIDDLGQKASATVTFLRYSLTLSYKPNESQDLFGGLQIAGEDLTHITQSQATKHLAFPHSLEWRKDAVVGKRSGGPFISTRIEDGVPLVCQHQDGGSRGKPLSWPAATLPRTVLSVSSASDSPTALIARREMQSWRLMQLEPSALRQPDEYSAPQKLGFDGSHLAATLYRLSRQNHGGQGDSQRVYAQVTNRLAELIDDIHGIKVDQDEKRELFTIYAKDRYGSAHAARSLSDGTLRFLALAVLSQDPETRGTICLEEPENGIHPERIPAMLNLLRDIAVDVEEPMGLDNPLRQVIVNTHSPSVVQQIPDDSLLIADLKESCIEEFRVKGVSFSCLPGTWREKKHPDGWAEPHCSRGNCLAYLDPVLDLEESEKRPEKSAKSRRYQPRRVIDREDLQSSLF